MDEQLDSMTANLTKAQGLAVDVQIAAAHLSECEGAADLRDTIESLLGEITWAFHYIRLVAQNTDTSADGIVIPDDGGDE